MAFAEVFHTQSKLKKKIEVLFLNAGHVIINFLEHNLNAAKL